MELTHELLNREARRVLPESECLIMHNKLYLLHRGRYLVCSIDTRDLDMSLNDFSERLLRPMARRLNPIEDWD